MQEDLQMTTHFSQIAPAQMKSTITLLAKISHLFSNIDGVRFSHLVALQDSHLLERQDGMLLAAIAQLTATFAFCLLHTLE